jgi:hypothetical protein
MKDKELLLDEIEASHTLGGVGEGRFQGRGKWRGCRMDTTRVQIYNNTSISERQPYWRFCSDNPFICAGIVRTMLR